MEATTVKVIAVVDGDKVTYFTLEGIEIGTINGGVRETPVPKKEVSAVKGAVIRARTPEKVRVDNEKKAEKVVNSIIYGEE